MGSSRERDVLICDACGKRWHTVSYLLPWQKRCLACGGKLSTAPDHDDNDDGEGEQLGGGSSLVLL